jgi:hypothetical protein
MRVVRSLVLLLTLLVIPALASAQRPPDPRGPDDVRPDTTRFFPRWMMATAQAGVGWMAGPSHFSSRYQPGLDAGLSLAVQPAKRLRFGVAIEYHDLPPDPNANRAYYDSTGAYPVVSIELTRGAHLAAGLATASVRVWRTFWIEGGIGRGYFESGLAGFHFNDGATGEYLFQPSGSGWGTVVSGELRYEFQPNKRDRMFATAGWRGMDRGGERLTFIPLHFGYRFD